MKCSIDTSILMTWLGCLLLVAGCAPTTGNVSGTVTFKGEQLATGTISFLVQGRVFETEIREGAYHLRALPPGQARIAVVRLDPGQPNPDEALRIARQRSAVNKPHEPITLDPKQLDALQKKRHLLPYAYSLPNTSDLQFTILVGRNIFDIELQDLPK